VDAVIPDLAALMPLINVSENDSTTPEKSSLAMVNVLRCADHAHTLLLIF